MKLFAAIIEAMARCAPGVALHARLARRRLLAALMLMLLLALAGCAGGERWVGPTRLAPLSYESWKSAQGAVGHLVRTRHYLIHTTVDDRDFLDRVGQVMEGGLEQYQKLAPDVKLSDSPMECYIFATRPEWAEFTAAQTGADSAVYLQINRGGYTVRDWYVAYYIGDVGTYAVAAHEGWHQFVARHFRMRPPPFLEEGLATMFENIHFDGDLPRWNPDENASRENRLRDAVKADSLIPLATLVSMHAGDVVGKSGEQIESFYAQNWALARFLRDGEGGRYRAGLQKMLSDSAAGTLAVGNSRRFSDLGMWDPRATPAILETYLGVDLPWLDRAFRAYVRRAYS